MKRNRRKRIKTIIITIGTGLFFYFIIKTMVDLSTVETYLSSTPHPSSRLFLSASQKTIKQSLINQIHDQKQMTDRFQAGMNVIIYGEPDYQIVPKFFERLKQLNVNSIAITFPFSQEHWQANEVMNDATITPSIKSLEKLISTAHSYGFIVMLRPILDETHLMKTGHWRGNIQPKNTEQWFYSYEQLLLPYVELAEKKGAEIFNIGTEFNSLQKEYSDLWLSLMDRIRNIYNGKLIYSFNWDTVGDIPTIEFVTKLDYVGIDAYFPLDLPDHASSKDIEKAWERWTKKIGNLLQDYEIMITEAGVIPITGAYRTPWRGEIPGKKVDWAVQSNYYEGTFHAWKELISGLYWWQVTLAGFSHPVSYSPLGSPTEKMIQRIFSNIN